MKLTKEKAIAITIELWTWLAETGKFKTYWPGWQIYPEMIGCCPLCEYANRKRPKPLCRCDECPYGKAFGGCLHDGTTQHTTYSAWISASGGAEKRTAAKAFLAQLKELK